MLRVRVRVSHSGSLANLTELLLDNNKIGDAGVIAFASAIGASGALAKLTRLSFHGNNIWDAGMTACAGALKPNPENLTGAFPKLAVLFVSRNPGNTSGVQDACKRRGITCYV